MPSHAIARHELADFCAELLGPLGPVRVRRMFGGHGFYVDDLFIAILADDTLFLKTDASAQPQFEAAGCRPFCYEGAGRVVQLSYWTAPDDAMESPAAMQPWARLAMAAALKARNAAAIQKKRSASATVAKAAGAEVKPASPAGKAPKAVAKRAPKRPPG